MSEMAGKESVTEVKEEEMRTTTHKFWDTQPVPRLDDETEENECIEPNRPREEVRQEPFKMPEGFSWCDLDVTEGRVLEEIYTLLNENYVEDDDAMFRFDYSRPFLEWALTPPGYEPSFHLGVVRGKKLMAFITGVPATARVRGKEVRVVEINYLCVHKKLRSKRLAPVLIKEITRRVNLTGVFQAVYTAGVVLPKPVASCRYWHRSLDPKKLIEIGFSRLTPRMTMARTIKLYRLPEAPVSKLRPLRRSDVPSALALVSQYLADFHLAPHFSEDEFAHVFLPRQDVVDTFVLVDNGFDDDADVDAALLAELGLDDDDDRDDDDVVGKKNSSKGGGGKKKKGRAKPSTTTSSSETTTTKKEPRVTDFISFYHLPSTVIGHEKHSTLKAAYSFYNVATTMPLVDLMRDALICAKRCGMDVFNALDIMHNEQFLKELKFGIGDGRLQYYLYNWKCAAMQASDIGLVLL